MGGIPINSKASAPGSASAAGTDTAQGAQNAALTAAVKQGSLPSAPFPATQSPATVPGKSTLDMQVKRTHSDRPTSSSDPTGGQSPTADFVRSSPIVLANEAELYSLSSEEVDQLARNRAGPIYFKDGRSFSAAALGGLNQARIGESFIGSLRDSRTSVKYDRHLFDFECTGLARSSNPRQELERGWALFNNASRPRDYGGVGPLLIVGQTQQVNNTAAARFGYTSEYDNGAILMPEHWSLFLNNCWILGGIKSGVSFACISLFEDNYKGEGNFSFGDGRFDSVDGKNDTPLNYYTMIVSLREVSILKEFGYRAFPDAEFGVIFKLEAGKEALRDGASFCKIEELMARLTVEQAMENYSGVSEIAPKYLDFLKQQGNSKETIRNCLRPFEAEAAKGTPSEHRLNAIARRAIKIESAMVRVEKDFNVESAKQEIRNCISYIVDFYHGTQGEKLSIIMKMEKDVVGVFRILKNLSKTSEISEVVRKLIGFCSDMKSGASVVLEGITPFKREFGKMASASFGSKQVADIWPYFQTAMAILYVQSGGTPVDIRKIAHEFLAGFAYIPDPNLGYPPRSKL